MVTEYGNNSMDMMSGPDKVRKRPATFLGSTGLDGAQHTLKEIIGNALDEHNSGFGDLIDVHYLEGGALAVRDYGRGIPLGWNERNQMFQWQMVYEVDFAGGKYKEEESQEKLKSLSQADWNSINHSNYREKLIQLGLEYIMPIGMNGLGSYATCASAEYLVVKSYRDGKCNEMRFEKGIHVYDELKVYDSDEPNGTYVEWKPDAEVFTSVAIKPGWVKNFSKGIAAANQVDVDYYNQDAPVERIPAGTMLSLLADKAKRDQEELTYGEVFNHGIDYDPDSHTNGQVTVMAAEIAIGPGSNNNFFANSMPTVGGAPQRGTEDAVATFFYEESKKLGYNYKPQDYSGLIAVAASMHINIMSARGQTKDSIDDEYVAEGIMLKVLSMLRIANTKHTDWVSRVLEEAKDRYEERLAVEEARKQNKEINKAIKRKANPSKFKSSRSYEKKDRESTELYIVEGKSAGGQTTRSRNSAFQCVYDIRGKGKNVYKSDAVEALTANAEIAEIMNIIGAGTDISGDFDMDRSRVGKVIMLSDADIDGYHIRVLTFLQLLKYVPEFLYEGRYYIAEPPLYMSKLANGEVKAFKDKAEHDSYLRETGTTVISEKRFKGLGAMEPEELAETCMNPSTRRLQQVKINRDDSDLWSTLNVLFGRETNERKRAFLSSMLGTEELEEAMAAIEAEEEKVDALGIENVIEVKEVEYR